MNSVNHHYIPQLYLKGFTSDNGRLQVFDKLRKNFKKDKQTPRTILFEKHRNTIKINGVYTDRIEKLYTVQETPFGEFFNYVRKGISQAELISDEGIYLLKQFIATQFWRMPLLDSFADDYILQLDLNKFGNRITINGVSLGQVDYIKRLLKSDKGFRHYFRSFYLPVLMFDSRVHDKDFHCWKLHTVSAEDGSWDNLLTGDNPIIVENIVEMFTFKSKLILPLSKTQLVTYSPNGNNDCDLPPIFSTKLAMVMNSQCQKYVVGANRSYMENINDLQERVYGVDGVGKLREELFGYI